MLEINKQGEMGETCTEVMIYVCQQSTVNYYLVIEVKQHTEKLLLVFFICQKWHNNEQNREHTMS